MNSTHQTPSPLSPEAFAEMARLQQMILDYRASDGEDQSVIIMCISKRHQMLREGAAAVKADTPKHAIEQLMPYWFSYFKTRARSDGARPKEVDDIDLFLTICVSHNLVPEVTNIQERCDLLAYTCLKSIVAHTMDILNPAVATATQVLQTWFEQPVITEASVRLENLVNLIYGPGAWELYGVDVQPYRVPGHLYKQGIPTVQTRKKKSLGNDTSAVELPESF